MSLLKKPENGVYGAWAGNPKGCPENPQNCVVEVWPSDGGWVPYQCARKRGHGPSGEYCRQHGKMADARSEGK